MCKACQKCHTDIPVLTDKLFDFDDANATDIFESLTNSCKLNCCEKGKHSFYIFWEFEEDKINIRRLEVIFEFSITRTSNIDRTKVHTEVESSVEHYHVLKLSGSSINKFETSIL